MTTPTNSTNAVVSLPKRLDKIKNVLRTEYLKKHLYPWVIAYSGGKDSTLLLQMVWETVANLPIDERQRPLLIVGNDTLVESPLVIQHLRDSLKTIGKAARQNNLPLKIQITEPCVDQTFWVNVIGRGYIPPTRNFRWCTDRMKILPTTRLLNEITQHASGAILLIGTRRAESQNRKRAMDKRKTSSVHMNPHGSIPNCKIFAPLADLGDDDIWMTLMQRNPPWGGSHRRLITLYRNAGGGECPLVVTKEQAPSCGSSSPRFGCWTCTVVAKDRSLQGLIDSGHVQAASMKALFDFREWLIELREDKMSRLPVRRNGNPKQREDGSWVLGPFKLEIRKKILSRLCALQKKIDEQLISPAEIDCIEDVWWQDRIREDARQALNKRIDAASNIEIHGNSA